LRLYIVKEGGKIIDSVHDSICEYSSSTFKPFSFHPSFYIKPITMSNALGINVGQIEQVIHVPSIWRLIIHFVQPV